MNDDAGSALRVCLFIGRFLPLIGGAEFVVHYLAAALKRQGVDVAVLPIYLPARGDLHFPYPVHQYRTIPGLSSDRSQKMSLMIERLLHRFDIVHAHQMQAARLAVEMRRWLGTPIVATAHGSDIQMVSDLNYGDRMRPGGEEIARVGATGADGLIAISRQMRERLIELGADESHIHLIPHGTAFATATLPDAGDGITRSSLGIANDALVTITVGRPSRIKGYEFLWSALDGLLEEGVAVESILVGAKREEVDTIASMAGVEVSEQVAAHLHLPGRVPAATRPQGMLEERNMEMASWYRLADVYVCTSYIESFSLTALDAMALGLPVIVPDTVGLVDLVRDGENGFIVPARDPQAIADRLRWLAEHRDECRSMGEQARTTASDYSWDAIARRHIEVYRQTLRDHRNAR